MSNTDWGLYHINKHYDETWDDPTSGEYHRPNDDEAALFDPWDFEKEGEHYGHEQVVQMSGVDKGSSGRSVRVAGSQVFELRYDLITTKVETVIRPFWELFWVHYAANKAADQLTTSNIIRQKNLYSNFVRAVTELTYTGCMLADFSINSEAKRTLSMAEEQKCSKMRDILGLNSDKKVKKDNQRPTWNNRRRGGESGRQIKEIASDEWQMNRKPLAGSNVVTNLKPGTRDCSEVGETLAGMLRRSRVVKSPPSPVVRVGGAVQPVQCYDDILKLTEEPKTFMEKYCLTKQPYWRREMDIRLSYFALRIADVTLNSTISDIEDVFNIQMIKRAKVLYLVARTQGMKNVWPNITVDGVASIAMTLTDRDVDGAMRHLCAPREPIPDFMSETFQFCTALSEQHHISPTLESRRSEILALEHELKDLSERQDIVPAVVPNTNDVSTNSRTVDAPSKQTRVEDLVAAQQEDNKTHDGELTPINQGSQVSIIAAETQLDTDADKSATTPAGDIQTDGVHRIIKLTTEKLERLINTSLTRNKVPIFRAKVYGAVGQEGYLDWHAQCMSGTVLWGAINIRHDLRTKCREKGDYMLPSTEELLVLLKVMTQVTRKLNLRGRICALGKGAAMMAKVAKDIVIAKAFSVVDLYGPYFTKSETCDSLTDESHIITSMEFLPAVLEQYPHHRIPVECAPTDDSPEFGGVRVNFFSDVNHPRRAATIFAVNAVLQDVGGLRAKVNFKESHNNAHCLLLQRYQKSSEVFVAGEKGVSRTITDMKNEYNGKNEHNLTMRMLLTEAEEVLEVSAIDGTVQKRGRKPKLARQMSDADTIQRGILLDTGTNMNEDTSRANNDTTIPVLNPKGGLTAPTRNHTPSVKMQIIEAKDKLAKLYEPMSMTFNGDTVERAIDGKVLSARTGTTLGDQVPLSKFFLINAWVSKLVPRELIVDTLDRWDRACRDRPMGKRLSFADATHFVEMEMLRAQKQSVRSECDYRRAKAVIMSVIATNMTQDIARMIRELKPVEIINVMIDAPWTKTGLMQTQQNTRPRKDAHLTRISIFYQASISGLDLNNSLNVFDMRLRDDKIRCHLNHVGFRWDDMIMLAAKIRTGSFLQLNASLPSPFFSTLLSSYNQKKDMRWSQERGRWTTNGYARSSKNSSHSSKSTSRSSNDSRTQEHWPERRWDSQTTRDENRWHLDRNSAWTQWNQTPWRQGNANSQYHTSHGWPPE